MSSRRFPVLEHPANPGNLENLENLENLKNLGNLGNLGNPGNLDQVSRQYADLVRHGLWFTPLRTVLDSSVGPVQERVTGVIRLKLFKGQYQVHDNSLVRTI